MDDFKYDAPAEIFISRRFAKSPQTQYRRFPTAAEAVRFLVEELPVTALSGALMEVNEVRFDGTEAHRLYASPDYPLPRQLKPAAPVIAVKDASAAAQKGQYTRVFLANMFGLTIKQAARILDLSGGSRDVAAELARKMRFT